MRDTDDTSRPLRQEPLLTRPVWWFLLFSLIANSSLSLLFAVLPLFAERATGFALVAGLTTGAMMLATVLVELVTPRVMAILGYRRAMEIGALLMGLPALVLIAYPNLATILTVAALRGAGLAIAIVAGTALAAQVFPSHRRAEGLGIYGVAVSIPAITLLPLGLWLAERYGFDLVFVIAALLVLTCLPLGRMLPTVHPGAKPTHGILTELRDPGIRRPTVIFGCSTLAIGILVTYLALAVPEESRNIAAIGLFVQAVCTTIARWGTGRLGDRIGSQRILAPSMLLCATGMLCLVFTSNAFTVIVGMAIFGFGLGGSQNASLAMMFERARPDRVAQVSVIWNLAYDAGMGIGAVGFGLVSGVTGYPWGFAIVAALLFATVLPAWRDRHPALDRSPQLAHS
ncbi:MAG: MFS transporter [Chloroflexia bacterium]|nr:MFS transporter [Chloroflexia bacterium]